MPIPNPKAGTVFIWIISFLLFLSVTTGGGLLLYYMLKTQAPAWYPLVGVGLICLPWFFWFLTCIYRIFSRILGLRVGDRDGGAEKVGNRTAGEILQQPASLKRADSSHPDVDSSGSGGRHVHFGAAMVVVNEQEDHGRGGQGHDQEDRDDGIKNHGSSTSSSNDISIRSHESELPLALSMA